MTDGEDQRPVRRPVVVTAMLLIAGAALLVALRSWLDRPAGEIGIDADAHAAAESAPDLESAPAVEPVVAETPPVAPPAVPIPIVTQAERATVIMLPSRVESSDPDAAAVTEAIRQSTLRALRAMPNIDVVEIGTAELAAIVPPNAGPLDVDHLVFLAVTRLHEGREIAEISEQSATDGRSWSIYLTVRRQNGGGSSGSSVARNGDPRFGEDAESMGIRFAQSIARGLENVPRPTNSVSSSILSSADARNVLLDATRSDQERLRSLSQLASELDSAAIAGAVDLATRSASAETRLGVWTLLRRRAYEPALAQPMSYALLSDADAAVREEAALGLAAYIGDAAALAALEHAARNDSSPEVRLAARMAAMDYDEQQAFKREALLDSRLTPAERLAPTIVDNGMRTRMGVFDRSSGAAAMEEALAYAEIVAAVEDPELKLRGLSQLQMRMFGPMGPIAARLSADDSKLVDALIEISRDTDERVRRQALESLTSVSQMSGNPEARVVLESVLENEPGLAAELRIAEALARPPFPSVPAR